MQFIENQPIYLQIADRICESILMKKWALNERIPSVREVAVMMEVNPNTALRAFTFLQDKDIIQNKRGIGYFVGENGYEQALSYKRIEFIERDAPTLFKTMKMLNLSCQQMEELMKSQPSR